MKAVGTRGSATIAVAGATLLIAAPIASAAEPDGAVGSSGSSDIGITEILSWAVSFLASALGIL